MSVARTLRIHLIAGIAIMALVGGCKKETSSGPSPAEAAAPLETRHGAGVSVGLPGNWMVSQGEGGKLLSASDAALTSTLTIRQLDAGGGAADPKARLKELEGNQRPGGANASIDSATELTVAGLPAYRVVSHDHFTTLDRVYVVNGSDAFSFVLQSPNTTYATRAPTFDAILQTARLGYVENVTGSAPGAVAGGTKPAPTAGAPAAPVAVRPAAPARSGKKSDLKWSVRTEIFNGNLKCTFFALGPNGFAYCGPPRADATTAEDYRRVAPDRVGTATRSGNSTTFNFPGVPANEQPRGGVEQDMVPVPAGYKIGGTYSRSSSSNFGGVAAVAGSTWTFRPDGTFENDSYAGTETTAHITGTGAPAGDARGKSEHFNKGTYKIDNGTLTLTGANGATESHIIWNVGNHTPPWYILIDDTTFNRQSD